MRVTRGQSCLLMLSKSCSLMRSKSYLLMRSKSAAPVLALPVLLASLGFAQAHPHILIDARAEVEFNAQGQLIGVRNIWDFDDAFSAYSTQGYDSKRDGKPTRKDLQPLAEINVKSLAAYNFFTEVKLDGTAVPLGPVKDYWDEFAHEKLTLRFTLPTAAPVSVAGKKLEIDVYDPEYFAAIAFDAEKPVDLVGTKTCTVAVHRPEPLDAGIASQLSIIPANVRELPDDLRSVTEKLVNGMVVTCR